MTRNFGKSSNAAAKKMRAIGMKRLQDSLGVALPTLYKWASALDDGRGIKDTNKRRLIAATAGTSCAIAWVDFDTRVSS